jgi:hypothetical protein
VATERLQTSGPLSQSQTRPLLWDRVKPGVVQTHVLVIGVGHYRHLPGGDGPIVPADREYGLGQLTSLPISARAFAKWMLTNYENPVAPIGSVDLLLSERPTKSFKLPGRKSARVGSATGSRGMRSPTGIIATAPRNPRERRT